MHVGLLCDTFPPELDGVGMVVESYGRELTALGEDCYLIAPSAGDGEGREYPFHLMQYRGVKLPQIPYRAGLPGWDPQYLLHARDVKLDILHAHSPFGAGAEALRLARVRDIPLVGTFHSKYYDDFVQATGSEALAEAGVKAVLAFYHACDEVWTVNEATAGVLRDYGFKKDIRIMPNGTDLRYPTEEDRRAAETRYGLGSGPVFLYVGQQNRKKNIRLSLEALAVYRRRRPDFRMVMVGQGPHEGEIRDLAEGLGIGANMVFTGQIVDRERLMGLYARADLFLFPSLYDTAGLVVREAAACGTPALLLRGCTAAECIRENENGFLAENTPEDFAGAIARIMGDDVLRRRVGEEARRTIPIPWSAVVKDARARYRAIIRDYDMREIPVSDSRFTSLNGDLEEAAIKEAAIRETLSGARESIRETLRGTRESIRDTILEAREAIREIRNED